MTRGVPKESALVTAILELAYLQRHLIRLTRTQSGEVETGRFVTGGEFVRTGFMRLAEPGWADLTGFVPRGMPKRSGKAILVECKAASSSAEAFKLLEPGQVENLQAVVEAGGVGILAFDSVQFWAEYLDAVGMVERGGIIVPHRKPRGVWKSCECQWRAAA